ncbi:MAG: PAS domain-containing protein [Tenuifilaceae bacterium]|nr:PAS domain-containing protein [Tenuifilaceae bacterium]
MAFFQKTSIKAKLLMYILVTSVIVISLIGFLVLYRTHKMALKDAQAYAISSAEKAAGVVKSKLEFDLGFARSFANSLNGFYKLTEPERDSTYFEMIKHQVEQNPQYVTVWYNLEYAATNANYDKNYGRRSISTFLQNGHAQILIEEKNMTGDIVGSEYHKAKMNNIELLSDPYPYKYDGVNEVLVTSLSSPIKRNGNFAGIAGVDITLEEMQELVTQIKPYPNSQSFLLSNNSTFVAHPNELNLGKSFQEIYPEIAIQQNVISKVQTGTPQNFFWQFGDGEFLLTFEPVTIGNINSPWAIGIIVPMKEILFEARKSTLYGILIAVSGLIVLILVLFYVAQIITKPIVATTQILNDLALGDIDQSKKLTINTGDELGMMANSVNKLIDGLNLTENFAREIGKGNLDTKFETLSEKDLLGISLIDMQKSLNQAKITEEERNVEETKQNWATQGMAKFGEILRQNNDNINELSYNTIRNLVEYTGSNQGGMFIINENDRDNPILEMTACFAYDRRKYLEKQIELGEGLVGRCYREGKTIFLTDIPENYITISSGLGQERPRCLILVPLKNNDEKLGVIEIASFKVLEKHQIEFIEKLTESIAATISSVNINIRTAELLAKSQQQAEEMQAQEEEMRQNMEELQATQEEMERKRLEQEEIQEEFKNEILLLEAIMKNIPDQIYFKDESSHFIRVSKSMVKLFNANNPNELVGKSELDYIDPEKASKLLTEEQEIMQTLTPIVDRVVFEEFAYGEEQWVSTTKMPLFNSNGEVVGTWGVRKVIDQPQEKQPKTKKIVTKIEQPKVIVSDHEYEYQAIIKALDSTTFVVEYKTDGTILHINQALLSIMGQTADAIIGKHHSEFFKTKADNEASYNEFWDDLGRGIIRQRVFKGSLGGSRLALNETYSPVINDEGKVEKIIAIAVKG